MQQATLYDRQEALEEDLLREGGRLRILWVKIGGLWPVNTGGRLRSFHILKELSKRHDVTLMTTHGPEDDPEALRRELGHCRRVVSLPWRPAKAKQGKVRFAAALACSWFSPLPVDLYKNRSAALRREARRALDSGEYDLCIADFLSAVPHLRLGGEVPVLLFSHNVEYRIWQRLCSTDAHPLRRALLALEWRKMRRFEHAANRRADLCVAVSDEDRDVFRAASPRARIESVPTGVDIDYFKSGGKAGEQPLELVFTGSMDWHPNEDAMLYFIDSILPAIRREVPEVTLSIVGRNPGAAVQRAAQAAGVRVTGTVDDVRPWIERAAVYIVPLRVGGGTRLKIFEALAMGKAVVSTTVGAEGLPLEEGRHILRADDPRRFAAQVVALLRDPARRRRMGEAGRRLMEEKYSWPRVTDAFEDHCRTALECESRPARRQAVICTAPHALQRAPKG